MLILEPPINEEPRRAEPGIERRGWRRNRQPSPNLTRMEITHAKRSYRKPYHNADLFAASR